MGIIFNRIKRISSSYLNKDIGISSDIDEKFDDKINMEEDDYQLRKKIEELENKSNESGSNKNSDKNYSSMNSSNKMSAQQAALVLGVNSGDDFNIIESAYRNKIKEYHPDLVSRMGDEIRQLAATRTLEINLAYEILKKSKGK